MVTPLQLDAVFLFIKEKTELGALVNNNYIWNLYISKTPELGIDQLLFSDIINKLIKDGYVKEDFQNSYHLTVDGRNFKGYVWAAKWHNKLSAKNITEGIIYSLAVFGIVAILTFIYHLFFK
ncbi:hypothetical protein DCC81_03420 [Chitinophaga parva]|uniref:Uncharacterized protein n=1 Tax=Chitinophaga parva TaxID=2169414 RepID=A0A2T7BLI4_9BACT|nr:hypothetical protein [Chitinophaga parva]PUZ28544.1 hypothetical protein DCC81_03420 [Chitinophaga parva]